MTRCAWCGEKIEREADAWWEITAWEKTGRAVADRKRTGFAICDACHTRRKYGGSIGQGDLLNEGT